MKGTRKTAPKKPRKEKTLEKIIQTLKKEKNEVEARLHKCEAANKNYQEAIAEHEKELTLAKDRLRRSEELVDKLLEKHSVNITGDNPIIHLTTDGDVKTANNTGMNTTIS